MPLAIFGITNDWLNLFVSLLVLFLVVVWIALVAWTYLDARRRVRDPVLVGCATIASLFPYVGTVVYSILRPPEFLEDAHERELEIRAAELRLRQLEEQSCPRCEHPIERTYLRCPNCKARVKDPCDSCGKPIDPRWALCPYCETPVQQKPQTRRVAAKASEPRADERAARPKSRQPAPKRAARSSSAKRAAPKQRQTTGGRRTTGRSEGPGDDRPRPATAP
jgi:Double zinc ribbon